MKTESVSFEIGYNGGCYLVKYSVDQKAWSVWAKRGDLFIKSVDETRTHKFKNETRAKEILKAAL